jgi:hypothetical protein
MILIGCIVITITVISVKYAGSIQLNSYYYKDPRTYFLNKCELYKPRQVMPWRQGELHGCQDEKR